MRDTRPGSGSIATRADQDAPGTRPFAIFRLPNDAPETAAIPPDRHARPDAVHVIAPARLHLGFLDLHGGLGRRFGGLGLAVEAPATEVVVSRAAKASASGAEAERALKALLRFAAALNLGSGFHVEVKRAIPAHAGLGSGTQLAVAIGSALARLERLERSAADLGEIQDRGARSAIGIASFTEGGFIVDGGKTGRSDPPPVLMRADFPSAWRVLLVYDRKAEGVSGDRELAAFAGLPEFTADSAAEICRIVLMQVMPGIVESDIAAFGAGITRIQAILGQHFAAAQGGSPWTSPAVGKLVGALGRAGAVGLGQSSWGPTGFAFAESAPAAERLYASFVQEAKAMGLEIEIACGRNAGARIEDAHARSEA